MAVFRSPLFIQGSCWNFITTQFLTVLDLSIYVPCSVDEVLSIVHKNYPDIDIINFAESSGGTGGQVTIDMGGGSSYTVYQGLGNSINSDGSSTYSEYRYPVYIATPSNISVNR
ncbi:MAG: hypothetical protein V7L21_33365 [Nostoc sp.]|nr:hypothetical protein [Nostoc sp. NMS9]